MNFAAPERHAAAPPLPVAMLFVKTQPRKTGEPSVEATPAPSFAAPVW